MKNRLIGLLPLLVIVVSVLVAGYKIYTGQ